MLCISSAIFAKPLATKFGKAEVSVVSNLFAAAVMVLLWVVRPDNVWVYCALQMLCWLGLGVFSMVSWALITDVIDYSELKNGIREDGSVYAMYSFARKLGQALAAGLSGWLLTAIGYSSEAAAAGQVQSDAVLSGIFNISTLIPAIGFAGLAAVLWFWYPLHKKQVDENIAEIFEEISIVEMEHAQLLMDAIVEFGGIPKYINSKNQPFTTSYLNYDLKLKDMLENNIADEQQAIKEYTMYANMVTNPSLKALLLRIAEDEKLHLQTFKSLQNTIRFLSV